MAAGIAGAQRTHHGHKRASDPLELELKLCDPLRRCWESEEEQLLTTLNYLTTLLLTTYLSSWEELKEIGEGALHVPRPCPVARDCRHVPPCLV